MEIKMWTAVMNGELEIFTRIKGIKYRVPKFSPYIPYSVDSDKQKPLIERSLIACLYRMRKAMYGENIGDYPYKIGDKFAKYNSTGTRDYSSGIAKVLWADPCGWLVAVDIPKLGRYYTNYDDMNKILNKYGYRKLNDN